MFWNLERRDWPNPSLHIACSPKTFEIKGNLLLLPILSLNDCNFNQNNGWLLCKHQQERSFSKFLKRSLQFNQLAKLNSSARITKTTQMENPSAIWHQLTYFEITWNKVRLVTRSRSTICAKITLTVSHIKQALDLLLWFINC